MIAAIFHKGLNAEIRWNELAKKYEGKVLNSAQEITWEADKLKEAKEKGVKKIDKYINLTQEV